MSLSFWYPATGLFTIINSNLRGIGVYSASTRMVTGLVTTPDNGVKRGFYRVIKTTTTDPDEVKQALKDALDEFMTDEFLTIGIHEDEGMHDGGLTNAQLGAVHEFGADIDHPGGTSYGYRTKKDAEAGKVSFLRNGEGFMQIGVTGPHKINIPARSWLRPGVNSKIDEYLSIIANAIENGQTLSDALHTIGPVAVSAVQVYMTNLRTPPNAKSTVDQKGSSNPLIDTGELKASVAFKVQTSAPDEGI